MGYTHYWEFGAFVGEKEYKQALSEIRKLIKASPVPLANRMGTPGTKPALGATVSFNGVGPEDDYETFILRADPILETVREDRYPRETLNRKYFCKTASKPRAPDPWPVSLPLATSQTRAKPGPMRRSPGFASRRTWPRKRESTSTRRMRLRSGNSI